MELTKKEHVTLSIQGRPFEVVGMEGDECISRLFRFDIVCAAPAGSYDIASFIGADAAMTLHDTFGIERTVQGIISETTDRISEDGTAELHFVLHPHAYPLLLGRQSRVFQNATVVDIVTQIVSQTGQPFRWQMVSSYKPHEYCAQYREDDWTFATRMLEEEGIYFWFDHEGSKSTLVFSDNSASAPDLSGGAAITYAYESGLHSNRETIDELGSRVEVTPTKWTIGSFNQQKPLLKVTGSVGSGPLEIYDAPGGGPDTPEACARRAQMMSEACKAMNLGIAGLSSSVRLVPGMIANIVGHPLSRMEGRFLVTRARYLAKQRRRGGAAGVDRPFACSFDIIPQAVPYRPPAEVAPAKQPGLQTGRVVGIAGDEVHPDVQGRVRVQLRWDRDGKWDEKAGKWMRVAQRGTEESMLFPRIGWNVLTFNEEGEIDAPNVLSRIHDAEHPPTYTLPANKTRVVFKTATTPGGGSFNEIYFEDKKGREELFINASKDMTIYAKHVKTETVGHDSLRVVGNNHDIKIELDAFEHVFNDQSVSISGNEEVTVSHNRFKEVKQSETISVGGNRTISTGVMHNLSAKYKRTLNVGGSVIEAAKGSVGMTVGKNFDVMIGGAEFKASQMSIAEDVGKESTQIIGGARIEIAAQNMPTDVGEKYEETVLGTMSLQTDEAFIDGAEKTAKWEVGSAISGHAPKVFVEARDKIQIKCGSSVITILPDSIEISSPSLDLTGATQLKVVTQTVDHN